MTSLQSAAVEAPVNPIIAPARLTSEHRLEFRRAVLEILEQAAAVGAEVLEVDMSACVEMDASGLGVLVLLRKRARERSMQTRLLHSPSFVRQMLVVTRLETLFEFAPAV